MHHVRQRDTQPAVSETANRRARSEAWGAGLLLQQGNRFGLAELPRWYKMGGGR